MSLEQKNGTCSAKVGKFLTPVSFLLLSLCFLIVMVDMVSRSIDAREARQSAKQAVVYNTNDGLEEFVKNYFTKYDAEEMIPIIECESHFRHFDEDGSVLKNNQGSSATGVAQILASVHPDPHVLKKYNRRHLTSYKVEDFDIKTLTGNISYALILYKTRGVRDWECSKYI